MGDTERLFGYLEGGGKMILSEPEALLTEASKMPGLDGQKMSKSYNNTITLREDAQSVTRKIRTMPTDPARVRRTDPGNPEKCPVWQFHLVYSDDKTKDWVQKGCRSAGIGCLECKQPVIDAVLREQEPMRERAQGYLDDPTLVRNIIEDGCDRARKQATRNDARCARGDGASFQLRAQGIETSRMPVYWCATGAASRTANHAPFELPACGFGRCGA